MVSTEISIRNIFLCLRSTAANNLELVDFSFSWRSWEISDVNWNSLKKLFSDGIPE